MLFRSLVRHFPAADWDQRLPEMYNSSVAHVMDGVREFLCLHYRAAGRADNQYWRDALTRAVPDGLAQRLQLWRTKVPDSATVYPHYHGLPPYSYNCILLGGGGLPVRPSPALAMANEKAALAEFQQIKEKASRLVQELPSQNEYFAGMRACSGLTS